MIEQLLRERMDDAVAGIRPVSRLDDILAGPPGGAVPPPSPARQPRRITLLAAAVALVALAAFTAGWVVRSADRDTTRLDSGSTTTTVVGSTTTADRARVGDHVSLLRATLPVGVDLIDEIHGAGLDTSSTTLRLAAEDGVWTGAGPYLRITVDRAPGFGTQWAAKTDGDPVADIGGHDAYRSNEVPGLETGWTSLAWATGPDEAVEIQSKGVPDETVLAIARSIQVEH